jgi:hypothetical protein
VQRIFVSSSTETAMTTENSHGATGGVRTLLRLEALALFAAALLLYAQSGATWKLFAALILVPDLSFVFYLFGTRAGAIAYNTMHSTVGAFMLALLSKSGFSTAGLGNASALLYPCASGRLSLISLLEIAVRRVAR